MTPPPPFSCKNKLRKALMWFHLCFLECPPWLPWISLQSFWHNGTPTSDVSARRERGGQRGGRMGGVRKASLLLLITIPPPYSSSEPVLGMGGAELNEAAAEAERSGFFPFSFMCIFPIASSERCRGTDSGTQ